MGKKVSLMFPIYRIYEFQRQFLENAFDSGILNLEAAITSPKPPSVAGTVDFEDLAARAWL